MCHRYVSFVCGADGLEFRVVGEPIGESQEKGRDLVVGHTSHAPKRFEAGPDRSSSRVPVRLRDTQEIPGVLQDDQTISRKTGLSWS